MTDKPEAVFISSSNHRELQIGGYFKGKGRSRKEHMIKFEAVGRTMGRYVCFDPEEAEFLRNHSRHGIDFGDAKNGLPKLDRKNFSDYNMLPPEVRKFIENREVPQKRLDQQKRIGELSVKYRFNLATEQEKKEYLDLCAQLNEKPIEALPAKVEVVNDDSTNVSQNKDDVG